MTEAEEWAGRMEAALTLRGGEAVAPTRIYHADCPGHAAGDEREIEECSYRAPFDRSGLPPLATEPVTPVTPVTPPASVTDAQVPVSNVTEAVTDGRNVTEGLRVEPQRAASSQTGYMEERDDLVDQVVRSQREILERRGEAGPGVPAWWGTLVREHPEAAAEITRLRNLLSNSLSDLSDTLAERDWLTQERDRGDTSVTDQQSEQGGDPVVGGTTRTFSQQWHVQLSVDPWFGQTICDVCGEKKGRHEHSLADVRQIIATLRSKADKQVDLHRDGAQDIARLRELLRDALVEQDRLRCERDGLRIERDRLVAEHAEKMTAMRQERERLASEVVALRDSMQRLRRERDDALVRAIARETERDKAAERLTNLQGESERAARLQRQVETQSDVIENLHDERDAANMRAKQMQDERDEAASRHRQAMDVANELQRQIEVLRAIPPAKQDALVPLREAAQALCDGVLLAYRIPAEIPAQLRRPLADLALSLAYLDMRHSGPVELTDQAKPQGCA